MYVVIHILCRQKGESDGIALVNKVPCLEYSFHILFKYHQKEKK